MISIRELHKEVEHREEQKIKTYQMVFEKCVAHIKKTNTECSSCCCFYECPQFIYGIPLFDVSSCVIYIMNELIHKGFEVYYTHPNLLYISWKTKPSPDNARIPSITNYRVPQRNFRMLEDTPNEKVIYHSTDFEALQKKSKSLLF